MTLEQHIALLVAELRPYERDQMATCVLAGYRFVPNVLAGYRFVPSSTTTLWWCYTPNGDLIAGPYKLRDVIFTCVVDLMNHKALPSR